MADKPIASQDLYLDKTGTIVVPAGLDAAFLLVRAGKPIPVGWVEPVEKTPVKKTRKKPVNKARKAGGDK